MTEKAENRYALYHWMKGIETALGNAGRSLFMCDQFAMKAESASPILSPAQIAQANGGPAVDERTAALAMSEQHRRAATQELHNMLAFAQQLAHVLNPPKVEPAPDSTVGGRLNGLHIAE